MTLAVLRPNGVALAGNWTIGGGAASLNAATSDDSDATWAESPGSVSYFYLSFGTVTIPALAQIRSVTPRLRVGPKTISRGSLQTVVYATGEYSSTWFTPIQDPGQAIQNLSGPSFATSPSGDLWTQTDINNLEFGAARWVGSGVRIYEAYLDVLYNEAPVVAITSPTASQTITTTSTPTISWSYTDPDGDGQERVEIKVFSGTTSVPNPNTEVNRLLFAITINTQGGSYQLPAFPNGGYTVAIRAADVGSNGRFGNWVQRAYTLNVVPPPAPVVTATADNVNKRISIVITPGSGTPTPEYFIVEVDNGDNVWQPFRLKVNNTGGPVTIYDTLRLSGRYRAVAVDQPDPVNSPTVLVVSAPSAASAVATITPPSSWQLVDFYESTPVILNVNLVPDSGQFEQEQEQADAVFSPLGAPYKVVVAGQIYGEQFDLKVFFNTKAEYDIFKTMWRSQRKLLLRNPQGEQWFIRLHGSRLLSRAGIGGNTQRRIVTVSAIETSAPAAT